MQADGHKWNTINQSHVDRKAIKKLHYRGKAGPPTHTDGGNGVLKQ